MAGHPQLKIVRLRALIDHPRTPPAEREAAQRMLDRLIDRGRPATDPSRTYGSKHDRAGRHGGLPHVVDMIRQDIALARTVFATTGVSPNGEPDGIAAVDPIGDAPDGITYDVDSPQPTSVVVTIGNVPHEWGWDDDGGVETVSPALRALADDIAVIVNDYNRWDSDGQRRFFGRVKVDGDTLVW